MKRKIMSVTLLIIALMSIGITGCGANNEPEVSKIENTNIQDAADNSDADDKNVDETDEKDTDDVIDDADDTNNVNDDDDDALEDIGEIYFKEPAEDDIVFDEESGIQYVKNQLLISAKIGTTYDEMEEIVAEVDGNIVGYIEITCDYQIEFDDDKTIDELQEIADYIEGYPCVSSIYLNTVSEVTVNAID